MAKAKTKATKPNEDIILVEEVQTREVTFQCVGYSPLIMNRFQAKAWQELLLGGQKKNRAEQQATLKHDPYAEFRGSVYRTRNDKSPALIHVPNGAFHRALAAAALDLPGAKKAQIERLTQVVDINIELFGIPHIYCAMVRNSDIGRTPDVRTRAIFPEWACKVTVSYVRNLLNERTIGNLFAGAGNFIGIGDWRPQKGGPFGRWQNAQPNDPVFKRIVRDQGRKAQEKALLSPPTFDEDTAELLAWFEQEVRRREREHLLDQPLQQSKRNGKLKITGRGGRRVKVPVAVEDRAGNLVT